MEESPSGTPRRILFDGVPASSQPASAGRETPSTLPPPPWKRAEPTAVPIVQPNQHAATMVDIAALQSRIDDNFAQVQRDTTALLSRFVVFSVAFVGFFDVAGVARA
jgi:hypothetical protein